MESNEILKELRKFKGTATYYKHLFPGKSPIYLTDGCKYIRDHLNANWLFDQIVKCQDSFLLKGINFQIWTIKQNRKNLTWWLTCMNAKDENVILHIPVELSDIQIDYLMIWIIGATALLPTEY